MAQSLTRTTNLNQSLAVTTQDHSDETIRHAYLRLVEQRHSKHTLRAYARELRRFYAWMAHHHFSLSDLNRQHLEAYERFMLAPPESLTGNPRQFPFATRRKRSTIAYAMRQVSRFLDYCVSSGHLPSNPLSTFTTHETTEHGQDHEGQEFDRYFSDIAWSAIQNILAQPEMALPKPFDNPIERHWRQARRRWLVAITYHLGLRRAEVARSTMNAFITRNALWSFAVIGKRKKRALLPVSNELLRELIAWRRVNTLPDLPFPGDTAPLIWNRSRTASIGPGRIYDILTALFAEAGDTLHRTDPYEAQRLRSASPHWLRHTFATHLKRTHVDLPTQKHLTRHQNVQTLMIYQHTNDEEQRDALARLPGLSGGTPDP